ncbi:hypothetical protein GOHSU_04_01580 [Gordonia hirsuta DSM 44140 = NBRC 16056]|uniref:Uncharacterized protein n=1 Tax=Gordonia hirsuta DSM 44140 = NBRC 16056 TaxID=1121927 RepID=L7L5R6_9ACTN|nr:hypothetical protein GOHSU_04_01580 [Gordonia hirsuta DSM 44140 = NBRC 16056]
MQAYGFLRRAPIRRLATGLIAATLLAATAGCGLLDQSSSSPAAIEIPGTDAPVTETSPASLPAPSPESSAPASRSYTVAEADSYRKVIGDAPRVGLGAFHIGATTATGERMDDVSGVHFSTPDRAIRCSTGNNGANALVCAGERIDGRKTPAPHSPDGCAWESHLAVLSGSGAAAGGCANLYPVLFRTHILEFGSALSAGSFSCLSDVSGLYCLDSGSAAGFALTRTGYQPIHADQQAADALLSKSGR